MLAPVHVALGMTYEQTGKMDLALAEFQRALELDPSTVIAQYHIGRIDEAKGQYKEAEEEFETVVSRRPGDLTGYMGLGRFYYVHGRFADAEKQFKIMMDLQPDNPIPYENLGGTYLGMGRYEDAITVLKKGLTYRDNPDTWSNLGSAYMYTGNYSEACDAMKKAVDLRPLDHVLWRNLADCYRQVPSLSAQALEAYSKALEAGLVDLKVNPSSSDALSSVALYQAHLGHADEAQKNLSKALQLSPGDSQILFTSALVYEIIGHHNQALQALDKAWRAGYSIEEIEREPELRGLQSDHRYQEWLKQAKATPLAA